VCTSDNDVVCYSPDDWGWDVDDEDFEGAEDGGEGVASGEDGGSGV
jgi:hypothetical protein